MPSSRGSEGALAGALGGVLRTFARNVDWESGSLLETEQKEGRTVHSY